MKIYPERLLPTLRILLRLKIWTLLKRKGNPHPSRGTRKVHRHRMNLKKHCPFQKLRHRHQVGPELTRRKKELHLLQSQKQIQFPQGKQEVNSLQSGNLRDTDQFVCKKQAVEPQTLHFRYYDFWVVEAQSQIVR